jgi:pyruvate/2-oxoglutarate dehydrogenase complex dihydrolipoamide dehydrogenase (E3) component
VHPLDGYNCALLANVRPDGWTNPRPHGRYNLVVVGAGTAGLVTAAGAAALGARVALVERHLLGGDCLNYGCVPSKALIRCARAAAEARDAAKFGVRVPGPVEVDFAAVMERMRRLRAQISPHDSATRFRDLGVEVFIGQARFTGRDTIEVDGQTLQFARACIATGTRPAEPPIAGLKEAGYLTNETLFSLTDLPRRLAIVGGGPIGCEMAQAFARFGSRVYQIEKSGRVLSRDDPEAAAIVQRSLQDDGVEFLFESQVAKIRAAGTEKRLVVRGGDQRECEIVVDEILLAIGRAPNVEGLGLDTAGIEFDSKSVIVNDFLQTTNPDVYAAGDICSQFKFTHMADALARIVIQNSLFFGRKRASALTVPWSTYTDPELAHVGLSEREAQERGIRIETIRIELAEVDRAVLDGEEGGLLKLHVKKGTDRIVGATLAAWHAGEMISEITLAMTAHVGLRKIAQVVHPYPTQAEAIRKAADTYNRRRLTPGVRKLFESVLRWRR